VSKNPLVRWVSCVLPALSFIAWTGHDSLRGAAGTTGSEDHPDLERPYSATERVDRVKPAALMA
jgi:hypothetical protein